MADTHYIWWMHITAGVFLKWLIVYPLVVFLCLEAAFLIMGYRRFYNDDYSISAQPANAYIGDEQFGIQLNPGNYSVEVNKGLKFKTTHLQDGSRQVRHRTQSGTDVLMLGCSFTYGFGVNDEQHFTSLVQESHPELGIWNGGVPGYGTAQSLMQLESHLETDSLKLVLLCFSSQHFMRNVLNREYRSNLRTGYRRSSKSVDNQMESARFPFKTSCNGPMEFVYWKNMYSHWKLRFWFASVNWIQTLTDRAKDRSLDHLEVTRCLIEEMDELCKQNGVRMGVVCLDSSDETASLREQLKDMPWLDIHFDFENTGYTNYPYDSHPNAVGHRTIADDIQPFLSSLIPD